MSNPIVDLKSDPEAVGLRVGLARFLAAKDFRLKDAKFLAESQVLGDLMSRLVMRVYPDTTAHLLNYYAGTLESLPYGSSPTTYKATAVENAEIDAAFHKPVRPDDSFPGSRFRGIGAHDEIALPPYAALPSAAKLVRIGILGAGASGQMVLRALRKLDFANVTLLDRKLYGAGIWSRENVHRSRNNPRRLDYDGVVLHKTTTEDSDGEEVLDFIHALSPDPLQSGIEGHVESVHTTGPFSHVVQARSVSASGVKSFHQLGFQLLFNCMGLGKPKPVSDPKRMTTTSGPTAAGYRWQQNLSSSGQVAGKSFVLIGLGNSTGEMLVQLQGWQDRGVELDYRVLTHYPEEAIQNPDAPVHGKDRSYRVFRDLKTPNLVDYAGDLEPLRAAFLRARREGRIAANIRRWEAREGQIGYGTRTLPKQAACSQGGMFTLTGYQWAKEDYQRMGIHLRSDGYPAVQYDGEFVGRKGYFGLGPMIETPENRNALVIPGNIFRMHDLLMAVIFRALEATT